jgi:hypothetical protein
MTKKYKFVSFYVLVPVVRRKLLQTTGNTGFACFRYRLGFLMTVPKTFKMKAH